MTKTETLIMRSTRNIYSTPIIAEQFIWEQIKKKGIRQLLDIFKDTIPVEHGRMFKSHTADSDTYGP